MPKFRKVKPPQRTQTVNLAGGVSYKLSEPSELATLLATSFLNDKFYERASNTFRRMDSLIGGCDPEFICKALLWARNTLGMRSITHLGTAVLVGHHKLSGKPYATSFFDKIIHRPDDMCEIMAACEALNVNPSNALKRGFARAFQRFNSYSLAKYRGEGTSWKLIDVLRLAHPVPSERNGTALAELVAGTLRSTDTWESEISAAGKDAAAKIAAWRGLLADRKLGYFALLRNLRNIVQMNDSSLVTMACEQLLNEKAIRESLVLPFRFWTAKKELEQVDGSRAVLSALYQAADLSLSNVPMLTGTTCVILDESGSMQGEPITHAALFAAAIIKKNPNADLILFSEHARVFNYAAPTVLDAAERIITYIANGGTNFAAAIQRMNKPYDRLIVLSDMQGWMERNFRATFNEYCKTYSCAPFVFSWDLAGHGTGMLPESSVCLLTGWSEKIFEVMPLLEQDPKALVNTIRGITL